MTLDRALNEGLPPYRLGRSTSDSHEAFVVTLCEFPQCRGEGFSVSEAIRDARYQYGAILDCRAAWKIDGLLEATQLSCK